MVEGYDGHAVSLKLEKREIEDFKDDRAEGFERVK
jgi:hypothetical protein